MEAANRLCGVLKAIMVLILASSVAMAFAAPEIADAASSKAVKSISLKIAGKKVTKKTYSLPINKTAKIKTTVKPAAAKKKITYKSSKPAVASVNSKGTVKAKKAGTAKITVKVKGKNGKTKSTWVKIKVTPESAGSSDAPSSSASGGGSSPVATPVSVTLSPTSAQVAIGYDTTLVARTSNNSDVTWSTSNVSVAAVTPLGAVGQARVTGVSSGTAVITATSSTGATASCVVTVVAIPVQSVSLDQSSVTMTVGSKSSLKQTVVPSNATNRNVQWTSSNTGVVAVDANGVLTGIGEGTAQVTVTTVDGGKTATANVTVEKTTNNDVDGIEIGVTNSLGKRVFIRS